MGRRSEYFNEARQVGKRPAEETLTEEQRGRLRLPSGRSVLLQPVPPDFLIAMARRLRRDFDELTDVSHAILCEACLSPLLSMNPAMGKIHPREIDGLDAIVVIAWVLARAVTLKTESV